MLIRGGIPGAATSAAATMSTASAMNCAAGLMPSAAQAAPIPDPTAAPMDQAACMIGMQGAPGGPLDGGALDVDHHVEGADARAGDHEGDREQRDRADDER